MADPGFRAGPRPVTPVGIAAAELTALHRELLDGEPLDDEALERLAHARDLVAGLDPYLETSTTAASAALAGVAAETAGHPWEPSGQGALEQEMLSGHVEGAFLQMLVHLTRARTALDIGMFTGYSSLAMAEALPPDGRVVACEVDAGVAVMARARFEAAGMAERIHVEVAPAADTLASLAAAGLRFDLVFLDADKPSYSDYLRLVLDGRLLAPHGVLAVDNTLMQGEPWTRVVGERSVNGEAIAEFNRVLADDQRVRQVLVPLRDGVTLVRWADPEGVQ